MKSLMSENWFRVDRHLHSVRKHLQAADTEEDFQAVGNLCRETIRALGKAVLTDSLRDSLPGVSNTDASQILTAYFQQEYQGGANEELRSYIKACLKLANALVHQQHPSYVEAELCVEACAHLVLLVRVLAFKEEAPPNKRFRPSAFASAEAEFMISWISAHFNIHPVAKDHGFTFTGLRFQGPEILLHARRQEREYVVLLQRPYWWKSASRVSADRLLDELLIQLLTELDKEHFEKSGQPPA